MDLSQNKYFSSLQHPIRNVSSPHLQIRSSSKCDKIFSLHDRQDSSSSNLPRSMPQEGHQVIGTISPLANTSNLVVLAGMRVPRTSQIITRTPYNDEHMAPPTKVDEFQTNCLTPQRHLPTPHTSTSSLPSRSSLTPLITAAAMNSQKLPGST